MDDSDRWREVPALSALDPNDNTRLPDGSRLVDALALAEVWRAVGGWPMSSDPHLLVQATPALLDGWCGPVVVEGMPSIATDGEVFHPDRKTWWYFSNWTVHLDLSRAECRDRVARVLARVLGGTAPNGVTWSCNSYHRRKCWHLFCHGAPMLDRDGSGRPRPVPPSRPQHFGGQAWPNRGWYLHVPALSALKNNDDTRLPDGSRLVDALALAEVWRAVGGWPMSSDPRLLMQATPEPVPGCP